MKRHLLHALTLLLMTAALLTATAATNYWDNNGDTPGFGTAGGTWGVDANWSADSTGASVPEVTDTTETDDLFFGTRESGLAEGTITVDGTSQTFRSLTFGAASGTITLSGGTLNLAEPASKVIVNNASNTMASVLAGTNGLHKFFGRALTYTNFLTESSTVIFTNAHLADYVHAGGIMQGAAIVKRPANAYHFVNDGTTATWQFQAIDDVYTKCVKVELTQSGSDIAGRAVYAKYVSGSQLGYDFDLGVNGSTVATSPDAPGYGVAATTLLLLTSAYEPFLTATPTVVLTNAALTDISSVAASMAGGSISFGPVPTTPYFFKNDGTTATVQMQAFNGNYTKCVKIELTQSGADIAARFLYAKYVNAPGSNQVGFDFDTGGTANSIAVLFTTGGYGLCQLRLLGAHALTLTGVNTYTGDTTIDSGVLEIGGAGQLGGGVYTGAVANTGQLVYNSSAGQTLCGNISGAGSLYKESPEKTEAAATYTAFLTTVATVIFPNTSLGDCTGADGLLGGAFINSGTGLPFPADAYHFTNDGATATFQLQAYDGGHTKCVKVALSQVGPDITGRAVYAKYLLNTYNLGFDFDTGGSVQPAIATSYTAGGYGVPETTITLFRHSTLTLSGTNSYTGGTFVNKGTLVATGSANSLPSTGGITVNDGGNLILIAPPLNVGNTGGVGNGNPITVNSGGTLTLASTFNVGYSRLVTLNGGTLNSIYTENNDNANYINNLVLQNGARVTGYKLRIGYHSTATLAISGSSPSSLEAGMNLVNTLNRALTVSVADVTGDSATDFSISGVIRDYPSFTGMPIVKTGAGTLSLSGANTHIGPITVSDGTLALDANNTLNTGNALWLNGGTLSMGSFTNAVGTLTLSANSTIALGDGALAFADSSGAAWTNGCSLTLTGTLGPQTVRVGTSATALTAEQLSAITYNGGHVRIRSDGYLSEWLKGSIIRIQ